MPIAGMLEGFQQRREANIKDQQAQDLARRQGESKVFEYLLQSNDPEMRALALSGLLESAQPGKKGKGLAGYMGEVQGGSFYPQILARMHEEVPDHGPAAPSGGPGSVPPVPGSAAMSANTPVRPGSQPIGLPGTPLPPDAPPPPADLGAELSGQGTAGMPGVGMPPPAAPLESKWKRRGTGVPTAEEIAEAQGRATLRGKLTEAVAQLQAVGAPPPVIQRALLGIMGAPPPAQRMSPGDAVMLADGSGPFDTLWIDGIQSMPDGTPVPPDATVVPKSSAGAGSLTSTIPDSPAVRQQYGIDPTEANPSGFWKVKQLANGSFMVQPTVYTPPPAYAGTGTIFDDTGVPQVVPINRGGGTGPPLGDRPDLVDPQVQKDAEALVSIVDRRVTAGRMPGLPLRPGDPNSYDNVTKDEAQKMGLPYTTYAEVVRAAKATPPVTRRQQTQGGSIAERVRARALENRRQKAGAPPLGPPAPTR